MSQDQTIGNKTNPFEDQANSLAKLGKVFKLGIHSGKGGVGKTFLAVNIAYSLSSAGCNVGILDADIDCPNVSRFLSLDSVVEKTGTSIKPVFYNQVKIVSTALLNPQNEKPIIIRGPIKHNMLLSFLSSVDWGELDILVIDLPPGTADVPLSAMQLAALDGLILITTPTKEAILDTARACNMAKQLGVHIIGLVENMSGEVFGSCGEATADRFGISFIASIPLSATTSKFNNSGSIAFLEDKNLQEIRKKIVGQVMLYKEKSKGLQH